MPRLNIKTESLEVSGSVNFNTNTLFDYLVGSATLGVDSKWYINGGLSNAIMGCAGRNGTFKSTLVCSLIMRAVSIYKDTECYIIDTEDALIRDIARILNMCGEDKIDEDLLIPLSGTLYDIDKTKNLIGDIIKAKTVDKKDTVKKEFIIPTPFMGKDGKSKKAVFPTFLFIDSYSEFTGINEAELLKCNNITEGKVKTIYMIEGGNKTIFLRAIRRLAERYGLVIATTAHIGDKNDMGSYLPSPKEMQFMKQSDAIKNVGSKYHYLTSPFVMITNMPKLLLDSSKNSLYPLGDSNTTDINEITVQAVRTKNSGGGLTIPFIVSQIEGLLPNLTNYHYLRTNQYFGLVGNKQTHKLALCPDITLTRHKIRKLTKESSRLRRGLELMAQYAFVKAHWNTAKLPMDFNRTPETLYEDIMKSKKITIEQVLDSRGYWCYSECNNYKKEYLSIFDILTILDKEKK